MSHVTVSELVENSPSLAEDGSVIFGSLSTTLYYIDMSNGRLLKTVSDFEVSELKSASNGTILVRSTCDDVAV